MAKPAGASRSARATASVAASVAASVTPEADPSPWDQRLLALLVLLPMVMMAVALLPELTSTVPTNNDSALHLQMMQGASDAMARGQNPLDFWMPQLDLGYPQFLYYQNLPHLLLAGVHRMLFGAVPLRVIFNVARYLLLVGLPLSAYWSMRRMEFSARAAAIGALAVSLVSSKTGFGLEYEGQLFLGRGVFTQLCAEHLAFAALGCLHHLMRRGRGYISTTLVMAALALSHFIWLYMMAMASIMFWLFLSDRRTRLANAVRLATVGGLAFAIASYMLVPFVLDGSKYVAMAAGILRPGYDPLTPIASLVGGTLLDDDRLPVLGVMIGLGLLVSLVRRDRQAALAALGTLAWAVLYQVRPTDVNWLGRVLRYDGNLIFRFVGVLEIFAIMLVGLAGEWIWQRIADRRWPGGERAVASTDAAGPRDAGARVTRSPWGSVAALLAILTVMSPALAERWHYFQFDQLELERTARALTADSDLRTVRDTLAKQTGGRAYIGLDNNWGEQLKVGPVIKAYDVLKFSGFPMVAPPMQGLSLNTDFTAVFRDGAPAKYDILDIRYAVIPSAATPPAFFQRMLATPRYTVYRVPTTGIAMFGALVERRAVPTQFELLKAIDAWSQSGAPAARQFIRWDYMTAAGAPSLSAGCPEGGHTVSESVRPGTIDLVVECPAAAMLVLKTTYHPNWRARVDDQPTGTFMVSPSYIALNVPAGRHHVVAQYTMAGGKRWLLALGLFTVIGLFIGRRWLDWLPQRLTPAA